LEYANEVVLLSPNPLSYATPPIENEALIPTPAPASVLAESDKENCGRCPLFPIGWLVPIKDMTVDQAEDEPRVTEVRLVTTGQCYKCSRYRRGHCMRPLNPYPLPVESDGDQSGRDEGGRFKY
jgi:hypothetical protein